MRAPGPRQQPEAILKGARAIRPHLADLLGAEAEGVDRELGNLLAEAEQVGAEAEGVDRELDNLLAEAEQGRKVASLILDLLARHDATRAWMREFLEGAEEATAPPAAAPPGVRGYSPPPGRADPIAAQKFVCPNGDFEWYRQRVGTPVPECPTHHVPLEPAKP